MNCEVDLQKVYTLGRYDGSKNIAPYVYPTDESMTAMRDSTPQRNDDGTFVQHHCAYSLDSALRKPERGRKAVFLAHPPGPGSFLTHLAAETSRFASCARTPHRNSTHTQSRSQ